jgi:hypothetical protein
MTIPLHPLKRRDEAFDDFLAFRFYDLDNFGQQFRIFDALLNLMSGNSSGYSRSTKKSALWFRLYSLIKASPICCSRSFWADISAMVICAKAAVDISVFFDLTLNYYMGSMLVRKYEIVG